MVRPLPAYEGLGGGQRTLLSEPGYTLAELCALSNGAHLSCERGRYDGGFIPAGMEDAGSRYLPASGASIAGQVVTADGAGLSGVIIVATPDRLADEMLEAHAGRLRFRTATDLLGKYSLDGLPEGEYTLRTGAHGPYPAARLAARTGVDYADFVLARNLTAMVTGRVVTETGEPLEGVTVLPRLTGQASVLSGYDGFFQLRVALKPGIRHFGVRLQRPGFREAAVGVQLEPAPEYDTDLAGELDVVLHGVEAWTSLRGTVRSDGGDPLPGRVVELRPRDARQVLRVTTDRAGGYAFPYLESPADYQLVVFGGAGYRDHAEAVRLTVDTGELDVVIASHEFGRLTGRLLNANGVPVPDFELVFRSEGSRQPDALVSTDAAGNFEIASAPAGAFVVASQSTPAMMVQGMRLERGQELYLPLVLDWGQHELRGTVVDARGNPVPASRVLLQWTYEQDGVTTRATRRTAADTQGHFAFGNLGPGPHSLRIDAPGFRGVDLSHDLSRQGYDVTVRLNSTS
jgi:hypothetical protein